jgi:hypothetical protein
MMKMLQKILSHGLLIAVIVAAFFIYMNRAELLPEWFGKAETTQAARVDEHAAVQSVGPATTVPSIKPGDAADKVASVPVEPTVSEAEQAVTEPAPGPEAVTSYRPLEPAEQSAVPDIKSADAPAAVAAPTYRPLQNEEVAANAVTTGEADTGISEVPAESMQPAGQVADSNVADQEPALVEQPAAPETSEVAALDTTSNKPGEKTVQQQLEEARQLYWQRDVSAATEAYETLGRDNPRNADIWGEIGNFYYSIHQTEPAAMAYYRTVSLLIDKGDTAKARQLLGVLYELDANRGRELDARLQQSAE